MDRNEQLFLGSCVDRSSRKITVDTCLDISLDLDYTSPWQRDGGGKVCTVIVCPTVRSALNVS